MSRDTELFLKKLEPVYSDAVNFTRGLCRSSMNEDYKDVFQQSLIKAWMNFSRLRDQEKFKSWFFTIIVRESRSMFRKLKLNIFRIDEDFDIAGELQEEEDQSELQEKLFTALSALKPRERELILLFEVGGFSSKEIAEMKAMENGTVRQNLSRIRRKLKEIIQSLDSKNLTNKNAALEDETRKLVFGKSIT